MQAIDFQHGDAIYHAHHVFFGQEVARYVQHVATVSEARLVFDAYGGDYPTVVGRIFSFDGRRKQQAQALQSIKETAGIGGLDVDLFRSYLQFVSFGFQRGVFEKAYITLFTYLYGRSKAACMGEKVGKAFGYGSLIFAGDA